MINRGGQILDTGTIGYVKPIRQQILQPGETLDCNLAGSVQMEALRERDALRINAHIAAFMTPIRWLDDNWVDYLKAGRDGSVSLATQNMIPNNVGLGGQLPRAIQRFWVEAPFRIYNEWYKWPEDPDHVNDPAAGPDALYSEGFKAVNLEHSWTRTRETAEPASADSINIPSVSSIDIRKIAEMEQAYKSAMQREVLANSRYIEILKEAWNADTTREVDKVPIKLGEDSVGVQPRSFPAQDGASLGQWASLYDFNVNFGFEATAPEHCIVTYMLTIRFAPITEEVHPLANANLTYDEMVGDPDLLSALPPQRVERRDVFDIDSAGSLGYLAAGWQWRAGNNQIGTRIDLRQSFPYMHVPSTRQEAKDATRRIDAFRSSSLGDYRIDLYASEKSFSAIPKAETSLMQRMGDRSGSSPYPKTGKVK